MKKLPVAVKKWVGEVFKECNERVATKLSKIPTTHETSLDLTFIEHFSRFSVPFVVTDWVVRIDTHYLGGGRHWGQWEIADIGLLVIFREGGKIVRTKVALLQSKRLYPHEGELREDRPIDYMIGFGRLLESDEQYLAATEPRVFAFTEASRYEALVVGDDQYKSIKEYEEKHRIPVYYLLYNPWSVPMEITLPIHGSGEPKGEMRLGCRVLPSEALRAELTALPEESHPSLADLRSLTDPFEKGPHRFGWRLEHFVVELLLECKAGYIAKSPAREDPGLFRVFSQRTAPISAAIAITIDAPGKS